MPKEGKSGGRGEYSSSFGRSVINDYFPLPLTLSDTILFKTIDDPASLKRLNKEATLKIACSIMAWSQEKPVALELGSEMPQVATSVVLYLARCFLRLTAVQLFITVQAVYENISVFFLSFTICRLCAIIALLPVYILQVSFRLLPTVLGNIRCLILPWNKLIEDTETYRRQWAMQVQLQLEGKYIFREDEIVRVDRFNKHWMKDVRWSDNTEEFLVCGARVRYVHLVPAVHEGCQNGCLPKRPILLLHGSRSWSYMWRKVCWNLLLQVCSYDTMSRQRTLITFNREAC